MSGYSNCNATQDRTVANLSRPSDALVPHYTRDWNQFHSPVIEFESTTGETCLRGASDNPGEKDRPRDHSDT